MADSCDCYCGCGTKKNGILWLISVILGVISGIFLIINISEGADCDDCMPPHESGTMSAGHVTCTATRSPGHCRTMYTCSHSLRFNLASALLHCSWHSIPHSRLMPCWSPEVKQPGLQCSFVSWAFTVGFQPVDGMSCLTDACLALS